MTEWKPRDRHTKRGKRSIQERIYKNRKLARERGKIHDGGLHSHAVDKRAWAKEMLENMGIEEEKAEVLATYTLQLIGPRDSDPYVGYGFPHSVLRETEENLTDLLPAGYSVEIKEWDSDE